MISANLRAAMAAQNVTVDTLADMTNVSTSTITAFRCNRGGDAETLCRIATYLHIHADALFADGPAHDLAPVLTVLTAKRDGDASKSRSIGENITRQRKLAGKTQIELANSVNIPRQEISRIENGLRTIKCDQLADVADYLGCPVSVLLPASPIGAGDVDIAIQIVTRLMSSK